MNRLNDRASVIRREQASGPLRLRPLLIGRSHSGRPPGYRSNTQTNATFPVMPAGFGHRAELPDDRHDRAVEGACSNLAVKNRHGSNKKLSVERTK
jgi:hypothetical protein